MERNGSFSEVAAENNIEESPVVCPSKISDPQVHKAPEAVNNADNEAKRLNELPNEATPINEIEEFKREPSEIEPVIETPKVEKIEQNGTEIKAEVLKPIKISEEPVVITNGSAKKKNKTKLKNSNNFHTPPSVPESIPVLEEKPITEKPQSRPASPEMKHTVTPQNETRDTRTTRPWTRDHRGESTMRKL